MIADTPEPPYTAVIFTSVLADDEGYAETAAAMSDLAARQPGWLGEESVRGPDGLGDGLGITVSYWVDDDCARAWGRVGEHLAAQRLGVERFYASYRIRFATVSRDRGR